MREAQSLDVDFDWVSVDSNAYDPTLAEAGEAAATTHVRSTISPFLTDEDAEDNVAIQQYRELMERYDPDGKIAYLGVQGLSAWLLFAKAADECGADLSRDCVWEKAARVTEWTGGGLHAPADLTDGGKAPQCWSLVLVEDGKFRTADIDPNDGVFACDPESVVALEGDYGKERSARTPNTPKTRSRRTARDEATSNISRLDVANALLTNLLQPRRHEAASGERRSLRNAYSATLRRTRRTVSVWLKPASFARSVRVRIPPRALLKRKCRRPARPRSEYAALVLGPAAEHLTTT